jgi:hypothetical protein
MKMKPGLRRHWDPLVEVGSLRNIGLSSVVEMRALPLAGPEY